MVQNNTNSSSLRKFLLIILLSFISILLVGFVLPLFFPPIATYLIKLFLWLEPMIDFGNSVVQFIGLVLIIVGIFFTVFWSSIVNFIAEKFNWEKNTKIVFLSLPQRLTFGSMPILMGIFMYNPLRFMT